jgi:hypothetical protein
MKALATEFKKHGRILRQVWRDENTAIYEYHGGYEVIVIKKTKAGIVMGKEYPDREVYPADGDWGTKAITRPASDSLDYLKKRARELYRSLIPAQRVIDVTAFDGADGTK